MKKISFSSVVWKEGRHYVAQCLNVDVSSFGSTKKGALKNLSEALTLYFEDAPKRFPRVKAPTVETGVFLHA